MLDLLFSFCPYYYLNSFGFHAFIFHTKKRGCMGLNATFNNISVISWWSVLLMEKTGVPEKTTYLNQWLLPLTLWVRTPLRRGVLDTILCGKVNQCFATGRWFSRVLNHFHRLQIELLSLLFANFILVILM
jgi:hypothetical protein